MMMAESSGNFASTSRRSIPKCPFKLKKLGRDGLVLQVHHTLPDGGGKERAYRFTSMSFDISGERLVVSDPIGNAFVIDLLSIKFWMLPKLPVCNFVKFSHYSPKKHDILIANNDGLIQFINCDSGEVTGELAGHKTSPFSVSFAEEEPFCVTVCCNVAIIWDLRSNSLLHQLSLRSSISIKQVRFMPVSNNILGLFEDSSVHIWKLENLECTKQIFPDEWGAPNIKAVAFTRNGRGMVMGGQSATLAVFLLDNWSLQKLIALPECCKGIKQLEFVPRSFDGGANKVLAVLSKSCSVMFVDTETSVLLKMVDHLEGCVSRMESSLSGKYIVLGMESGQVNIYASSQLITGGQQSNLVSEAQGQEPRRPSYRAPQSRSFTEVKNYIDISRLKPILKEFGEYPSLYRSLIWKSILNLPENQNAFVALINKGIHPAFSTLDKVFSLSDRSLSSTVKRLLSCLVYWSPIFLQVKYMPIFVLPFVKLMKHDQFACFETVASIIVNWCQGWFEYVPFPPLNVIDMVKKILFTFDNQLLSHFNTYNVTPDLYIWSLLETAFFEVLGWAEWQQLWDHVLSNHPAFLLFTVAAFNITCRSTLLNIHQIDDFEHFYYTEAVINMKKLITKAYQMWSKAPSESHPKLLLRQLKPLVKGNMYQMFTDYPKHLLDHQVEKLNNFYEEKAALENQQLEINKQKVGVDFQKKRQEEQREKRTRIMDLEESYKNALLREEEQLENQRRGVSEARRDLRQKEVIVRAQALDKTMQDKADKYAQLERLVEQIQHKKGASDYQSSGSLISSQPSSNPTSLRLQHASVVHHLSKLRKLYRQGQMAHPDLKQCISKFEDLLVRIESALEREQSSKQVRPCHAEQIINLEEETQALEDEAHRLLKKLTINTEVGQTAHCSNHDSIGCNKGNQDICYCCGDRQKD